jgi:uncharacterized DUF497 family protein
MTRFDWDETKRQANLAKHSVDILKAARIFHAPTVDVVDRRPGYGEERIRSVGFIGDECYVVVWTWRGSARRLISAWKGGRRDRERYQAGDPR